MKPTEFVFPLDLLETYDFIGHEGAHSTCGVLVLRGLKGATAIVSELEDNRGSSIMHGFATIATRLYRERLTDFPVWAVRWFARLPDRFYHATLAWRRGADPDGGYKHPAWRSLRTHDVLLLLREIECEVVVREVLLKNNFPKR